jgi:hypothetical protein
MLRFARLLPLFALFLPFAAPAQEAKKEGPKGGPIKPFLIKYGYPAPPCPSTAQNSADGTFTVCGTISPGDLVTGRIYDLDNPNGPSLGLAPPPGAPGGMSGPWVLYSITQLKVNTNGYTLRVTGPITGQSSDCTFTLKSGTVSAPCGMTVAPAKGDPPAKSCCGNERASDSEEAAQGSETGKASIKWKPVEIRKMRTMTVGIHKFVQIHGFARADKVEGVGGYLATIVDLGAGPQLVKLDGTPYLATNKTGLGYHVIVDIDVTHAPAGKYTAVLDALNPNGIDFKQEAVTVTNAVTVKN